MVSSNIAKHYNMIDRKDQRSFNVLNFRHKKADPFGKSALLSNASRQGTTPNTL